VKPGQKGSVLILVLFALITLSLLAFSVGYTVRQKLQTAVRFETRTQLRLAADAAADQVSVYILENLSNFGAYHALNQGWANHEGLWKKASVGNVTYYVGEEGEAAKPRAFYGLRDENRKINLNQAPQEVLQRLFQHAGGLDAEEARRIAAAIRDWRDEDSDLSDGGAESKDYLRKNPPYRAKDALFDRTDELRWVQGVSPELFQRVAEHVTVDATTVNLNTAPPVVLLAMGFNARLVDKIILFRVGKDGVAGTSDDGVFKTLPQVRDDLERSEYLSEADRQNLDAVLVSGISVSSTHFSMLFFGKRNQTRQSMWVEAVFNNRGKVLRWFEKFY